jgi:hypothetical protein
VGLPFGGRQMRLDAVPFIAREINWVKVFSYLLEHRTIIRGPPIHTVSEGVFSGARALPLFFETLTALEHIPFSEPGVCGVHYVACLASREGAGQRPALLLEEG